MVDEGDSRADDILEDGSARPRRDASWLRRWRWRLLAGATAVLVAATGIAVSGVLRQRPPVDSTRAVAIIVWLTTNATDAQADVVGAYLRTLTVVGEIQFEDREETYRRFSEAYADHPDLVAAVSPAVLAPSFHLTLADRGDLVGINTHLAGQPGVSGVVVPSDPRDPTGPEQPSRRGEVTVTLELDATVEQKDAIAAYLRTLAVVGPVTFVDRDTAYQQFVYIYRHDNNPHDEEQLAGLVRRQVPEYFRLTLANSADAQAVKDHLRDAPGVSAVLPYQDAFPTPTR